MWLAESSVVGGHYTNAMKQTPIDTLTNFYKCLRAFIELQKKNCDTFVELPLRSNFKGPQGTLLPLQAPGKPICDDRAKDTKKMVSDKCLM